MRNLAIGTAILALAVSGAAQAADIPVKSPVMRPAPAPVFSWQGCHIGVSGGGTVGRSRHDGFPPGPTEITPYFNISGGLIGAGYGCTYVLSPGWAIGTDSDFSWTNKRGSSFDTGPGGVPTFLSTTKESWLSTTRLRVGPTWDRLWLYGTGGLATARIEGQLNTNIPTIPIFAESRTAWGWTIGAGFEYAFLDSWSFKAEYLYARFQNTEYRFGNDPIIVALNAQRSGLNVDDHIFRVGVNYRFGCLFFCGGPVVAKY